MIISKTSFVIQKAFLIYKGFSNMLYRFFMQIDNNALLHIDIKNKW